MEIAEYANDGTLLRRYIAGSTMGQNMVMVGNMLHADCQRLAIAVILISSAMPPHWPVLILLPGHE